jgi:hypothetical protein
MTSGSMATTRTGDARTMVAKVLLPHALAAADQLDGQIEAARVMVEDAREGECVSSQPSGTC